MNDRERLDETVATPEEWEIDPFGITAAIIREACEKGIEFKGAMSEGEYRTLMNIRQMCR